MNFANYYLQIITYSADEVSVQLLQGCKYALAIIFLGNVSNFPSITTSSVKLNTGSGQGKVVLHKFDDLIYLYYAKATDKVDHKLFC